MAVEKRYIRGNFNGGFVMSCCQDKQGRRKPEWLKIKLPMGQLSTGVLNVVREHGLHTICTSGMCPNQGECWGAGTATFMIGGDVCTRACRFCNVKTGHPAPLDAGEPGQVAKSVRLLGLRHAVITSVDRDDLEDLGASHWVKVIEAVKRENPGTTMEVLIPDFQGRRELVQAVIEAGPEVFAEYRRIGLEKGFRHVESGPLVRSSYHAERHVG